MIQISLKYHLHVLYYNNGNLEKLRTVSYELFKEHRTLHPMYSEMKLWK